MKETFKKKKAKKPIDETKEDTTPIIEQVRILFQKAKDLALVRPLNVDFGRYVSYMGFSASKSINEQLNYFMSLPNSVQRIIKKKLEERWDEIFVVPYSSPVEQELLQRRQKKSEQQFKKENAERLKKEMPEVLAINNLVDDINELIAKIVARIEVKIPRGHSIITTIKGQEKVGWLLPNMPAGYQEEILDAIYISPEGYLMISIEDDNGSEKFRIITKLKKLETLADCIVTTHYALNSKCLSILYVKLELFYEKISKPQQKKKKD